MRGTGTEDDIGRQLLGRLTHRPVIGEYKSGLDRRLGLGAAFEQPALDQKTIGALTQRAHSPLLSKPRELGSGTMVHAPQLAVLGHKYLPRPHAFRSRRLSMARKYSRSASRDVERAMKKRKKGTLRSGRSGKKVKSRKQAIAIGLSEARQKGKKVP